MTDPNTPERRPRVLQVITHLDLGGAERVAMQLIEGLRGTCDFQMFAVRQDRELNDVGRAMAARLRDWGVPVHVGTRRGFKQGGALQAAFALARVIAREGIDVVHLHTEEPELVWAVASLLSRRVRRVAVLRTIHNSTLWIAWGRLGAWVTRRLARADRVAVSQAAAAADLAIDAGPGRTLADVLYNGVEAPVATGGPAFGTPFRVLFAGRFVPQKGGDLLPAILSAGHAATTRRDVAVTIAGRGPMADEIAAGLNGVAPGWDLQIVPPIGDLAARLTAYDCVLAPSRFEGFGLLPVEAMLAGVPVVTFNAPGTAEVLPENYPLAAAPGDCAGLGARLAAVIDDGPGFGAAVAAMRAGLTARFGMPAMLAGYRARYQAATRTPLRPARLTS